MTEQQIEAIEQLRRDYFPQGVLVAGFMPNGTLHLTHDTQEDGEHEELFEYLAEVVVKETERLSDGGEPMDGWDKA